VCRVQGWRAAAAAALGVGGGEAFEGAFTDEFAFHLGGHGGDHEQHLVGAGGAVQAGAEPVRMCRLTSRVCIWSSTSQVYRLVVERPERLSLKVLMALLDVLDCIPRRRPASTRRARRRHRGGALDGPPGAQHRRPAPAGAHPDGPGVRVQFVTENLAFTDCR